MNLHLGILSGMRGALKNWRNRSYIESKFPGTRIDPNVTIRGNLENLRLGKNVLIQSGVVLHLGGLEWCQNKGYLEIGDNAVISFNTVIYACGPGGVRIGSNLDCGPGVGIFASRTDYLLGKDHHVFEPVEIGNNVIIFSHSVISTGVKIGDGAVVASCSTVTRDVLPNSFVGGVPARTIRQNIRKA